MKKYSYILTAILLMSAVTTQAATLFKDNMLEKADKDYKKYTYCSVITGYHAGMAYYGLSHVLSDPNPDVDQIKYLGTIFMGTDHASKMYKEAAIEKSSIDTVVPLIEQLETEIDKTNLNLPTEKLAKLPVYSLLDACLKGVDDLRNNLTPTTISGTLNQSKSELNSLLYGEGEVPNSAPAQF